MNSFPVRLGDHHPVSPGIWIGEAPEVGMRRKLRQKFGGMSFSLKKKDFVYLFLEKGREGERERNINAWLLLQDRGWERAVPNAIHIFLSFSFHLFIFRERGREGERETTMCGCLSHATSY